VLQAGLLVNAFGNGAANPFLLLYLHDVRGIPLGIAGLVAATNACTALVTALVAGSLADRRGAVPTMAAGLVCSATAFCFYPLVREAWQAFPLAVLGGVGGGTWLTLQSSVVAAITPREVRHLAFAQQRVVANVGLGLGGLVGGLIVTVSRPETFTRLFLANAATFLVYAVVLLVGVHAPPRKQKEGAPSLGYREVARNGVFVRFAALNFVFVLAVVSLLNSIFPVFARNQAGLGEGEIGAVFLLNSVTIIVWQLPVARLVEGRRRMRALAVMGVLFAVCWLLVDAGAYAQPALVLVAAGIVAMSFGECIYDSILGPLVADLAPPQLLSRYMAVSGFSWQLGFIVGPAVAGVVLAAAPGLLWPLMSGLCVAGAAYALALEPAVPSAAARTARRRAAQPAVAVLRRR
jgi:MFS family permease